MVRKAKGLYEVIYIAWRIKFPYMMDKYLFFGPKSGAEAEAKRIQKRQQWPYNYSIKEVKI